MPYPFLYESVMYVIVPLKVSSPPSYGYLQSLADVLKFPGSVCPQPCVLKLITPFVSATKHWKVKPPLIYALEHMPPPLT